MNWRDIGLSASLLLALSSCGSGEDEAPADPIATAMAENRLDRKTFQVRDIDGVSREMITREIAPLFDGSLPGETRALVVMHGGEIIAEGYAPGYKPDTPQVGWSLSKTVTAVLIGLLVTDGRLSLDDPAPIESWSPPGDPRHKITVRHLLNMASGLEHKEAIGAGDKGSVYDGDTTRMLFLDGASDMAAYAENHAAEFEPGKKFEYSTATTIILADIIAKTLTDSLDPKVRAKTVNEFARGRLFAPVGLKTMRAEYDAAGTMIGGSFIHAGARDWAKFGEFIRTNGAIEGAQIIPGSWMRYMRSPSPANPAYGAQIWRNVPGSEEKQNLFPGKGPDTLVAGLGHYGQFILISPDQKLTIVRLGMNENEDVPAVRDQLARLVALFPTR